MIKVIDLQGCGFLEHRGFKNKSELRNTLFQIGHDDGTFDNTEMDLRKFTLNYLLDIWGLDIRTTRDLIIENLN